MLGTSPLHAGPLGLGLWAPPAVLLLALAPGSWGLLSWMAAVLALRRLPVERWCDFGGVPVELGEVTVPLTWGALAPRIVLPRTARGWPAARLRAVLAHERAHVVRRDYLRRAVGQVLGLVLALHPLFVWSWRRQALDVEQAADAQVLAEGAPRRSYAQALLDLGSTPSAPMPRAALSGRTHLAARIETIVRPAARSRLPAVVAVGVLLGLGLAMGQGPMAEPPPPPPPPPCA